MRRIEVEQTTMTPLQWPRMPRQPDASLSGLRFVSVATQSTSRQDVASYNPFTDPIFLVMVYEQGAAIQTVPQLRITGTWQLIEGRSNRVVVEERYESQSPLRAPFIEWPWNAGTAHDLKLTWLSDDLYGFRAFIEATYTENGDVNVDSFDVSPVRWFRLKPYFEL